MGRSALCRETALGVGIDRLQSLADAQRNKYRLVAQGKQDDVPVVQAFHLLAGPTGHQLVVTVVARQEKASRVGTRDVQLVNSIDLPKK